ncbi:MAG: UDP-N-acetylmuramate--L-alanine ligase [Kordiimonas sp.]|nr:UDP-N-acetylmuramate--L-alanine ligase [Kordiimonas sp.]
MQSNEPLKIGDPLNIGVLHFVGIGGIGMSGIAEVMHNFGYQVQGSDLSENINVQRLRAKGIDVFIGQKAENIGNARFVVISSAIRDDNPEVVAAREKMIPVVRRAEMLAELMRLKWCVSVAGTHGKTTTTSLMACVLDNAGYDPTVINGGIINAYGTNARLGEGDWMVVEADESDGTFVKIPSTIAVVTNIDPEHLDFYGDFEAEKAAFHQFIQNLPFYGFAVMCIDHPEVQALIAKVTDRKIITYGFSAQADVRAENLTYSDGVARFDVVLSDRVASATRELKQISLPMPGRHNVLNSLAAIAVGQEMGITDELLKTAFSKFEGVKRRFTIIDKTAAGVTVVDDYAHHPVEISAVLSAARSAYQGRIFAVVQPHRYSRLKSLFEEFCACFNDADSVVVTPIFAAGEAPLEGYNQTALVDGLRRHGHRHVMSVESDDDLPALLASEVGAGDVVICLGAGNITQWAATLPQRLDDLMRKE